MGLRHRHDVVDVLLLMEIVAVVVVVVVVGMSSTQVRVGNTVMVTMVYLQQSWDDDCC